MLSAGEGSEADGLGRIPLYTSLSSSAEDGSFNKSFEVGTSLCSAASSSFSAPPSISFSSSSFCLSVLSSQLLLLFELSISFASSDLAPLFPKLSELFFFSSSSVTTSSPLKGEVILPVPKSFLSSSAHTTIFSTPKESAARFEFPPSNTTFSTCHAIRGNSTSHTNNGRVKFA